jgi:hypothetical protein
VRHIPAVFVVLALGVSTQAQTPDNAAIDHAQTEVNRIRGLVEAGAMPRNALEKAESQLAEAKDELTLSETLYGKASVDDLTNDLASQMVAAAQRQVDRQQQKIDQMKALVDQGVLARTELTPYIEELDRRHRVVDLANARVRLLEELARMAQAEQADAEPGKSTGEYTMAEKFSGKGGFSTADFHRVNLAFAKQFGKTLPVSANGMTATHRALGFDHTGRVDVAVSPDEPEGRWLRAYLESANIPYFAFRTAVPGKATGAHIHLGPPSLRLYAKAAKPVKNTNTTIHAD